MNDSDSSSLCAFHRLYALVAAVVADGPSTVRVASPDPAVRDLLDGLHALGIAVSADPASGTIRVHGCRGHLPATEAEVWINNVDTVLPLILGLTCTGYGQYRLDVAESALQRPVVELVNCFRDLGAQIGYEQDQGYPPITIVSRGLRGTTLPLEGPVHGEDLASLLLVAPLAGSDVFIQLSGQLHQSQPVQAAMQVMCRFGAELVHQRLTRYIVPAPQRYRGCDYP